MKNLILFVLIISLCSCNFEFELPGFRFSNFENTLNWDLAKAVRDNDVDEIKNLVIDGKFDIDYKEYKFGKTLLSLAMINNKKESFDCLLSLGADPNVLCGSHNAETPLMIGAEYADNCNTYYLEQLIKYGAEVSKEVDYFHNGSKVINAPILFALENYDKNGHFCIDIAKLLCENGANINVAENVNDPNLPRGIVFKCLQAKNMIALRYFIIDLNIEIPRYVAEKGRDYVTLQQLLSTNDFVFEHYNENEKAKQDILNHLNKN
jgi:ankyrin repeat protein